MPKGSSVHCDIPCNKTQILHKLYKIKYTKVKHTKYLCCPPPPLFIMPKGSSVHCDIPCNKTQILHNYKK